MSNQQREQCLATDLQNMQSLAAESSILSFQTEGEPVEYYHVAFSGKGLARVSTLQSEVQQIQAHEFDIRLGSRYPEVAPQVRWKTSILHPNISYSGFVKLNDIGIKWSEEIRLDQLCERLWDVVRFAFVDLDNTSNYAARGWLEDQTQFKLPLDQRPLRDFGLAASDDNPPIQLTADDIIMPDDDPS